MSREEEKIDSRADGSTKISPENNNRRTRRTCFYFRDNHPPVVDLNLRLHQINVTLFGGLNCPKRSEDSIVQKGRKTQLSKKVGRSDLVPDLVIQSVFCIFHGQIDHDTPFVPITYYVKPMIYVLNSR